MIMEKQKKAKLILAEEQIYDEKSYREAAIGFVLDDPSVHSVLISFSNYQAIDDYINLSGKPLSSGSLSFINFLKETYGSLYCRHACGLCENMCPYGVPINTIMRFNHYFMAQGKEKDSMEKYYNLPGRKPDVCSDCKGFCEKACPYGVLIRPLLTLAHRNLSINSGYYS
jgi:predicted aldo/keto reductase-like oxidoreductase